jgi:hypothetical protein
VSTIIKHNQNNPNRQAWTVIAVLFMIGFLAGLGLRVFAGHQTTLILGPDHMATSTEQVFVHANDHLFVLTNQGVTLKHLSPSELQLSGTVIDLRVMPNGRLLIAERVPARIRLCDPDPWKCSQIDAPLAETLSNQFKVLPDVPGQNLYITDSTSGGGLYQVDISDGNIRPLLLGELSYANDIQRGPEGEFWIADSYHRRVITVRLDGENVDLPQLRFNTENEATQKERTWPMMLQALGDGSWAVTQPTATGGPADILIYQVETSMPRRLPLAEGLDPTDLLMVNGQLLASDILGIGLYTIDTKSGQHIPWGDQVINDWFKQQRFAHERYQGWVDLGLVLMFVCTPFMLIAGYLGTSREKRKGVFSLKGAPTLTASEGAPPVLSSIHWLKRNPKMDRLFRWMIPVMAVLVVIMLLTMGYLLHLLYDAEPERIREFLILFLVFAGIMAGMLPLMYINMDMVRGQLGTDGKRIFVRLPGGGQGSAMPGQIVYTKHFIHFSTHTVSIGTRKNQALYEDGEIETYIAPLLKQARKVNIFGLFSQQIEDGEYSQIYTWLYVLGAFAAVLYLEFSGKFQPLQ